MSSLVFVGAVLFNTFLKASPSLKDANEEGEEKSTEPPSQLHKSQFESSTRRPGLC